MLSGAGRARAPESAGARVRSREGAGIIGQCRVMSTAVGLRRAANAPEHLGLTPCLAYALGPLISGTSAMLIERDKSCLLIVDVQEKLAPAMADPAVAIRNAGILMQAAARLAVPLVVSEQYPQGLGPCLSCALWRRIPRALPS